MQYELTSAMITGDSQIDTEHAEWVKLLNELNQLVLDKASDDEVIDKISQLIDHMQLHFAHEEEIFDRLNSPFAEGDKAAHRGLLDRVDVLCERVFDEGLTQELRQEIVSNLGHWFVTHVCKFDIKIRDAVRDETIAA